MKFGEFAGFWPTIHLGVPINSQGRLAAAPLTDMIATGSVDQPTFSRVWALNEREVLRLALNALAKRYSGEWRGGSPSHSALGAG
jgi:hypothetical protein